MLEGTRRARDRFRWDYYGSPEGVVERRRDVLAAFISDFQASTHAGCYIAAHLPELPFQSESFDLVLCSHLLFLYSDELDTDMHITSLREMLRVGREVRLFRCSTWMADFPCTWRPAFRRYVPRRTLSLFQCRSSFDTVIRGCCA